jgi:cytochrome c-type biogenesis protein CcmH
MKRIAQLLLVCAAVFTFLGAGDEGRFNTLGHKMFCVCSCNQILLECNHVGCTYSDRMRGELAAGLSRGDSDDLILQSFVQKYGPTVVAAPTTTGFNMVAWVVPFVVLLGGIALVIGIVRAWKDRAAPAMAGGVQPIEGDELDHFRQQARSETDL